MDMTISYNLIIRNYIIFEGARMSTHLHIELSLRMSGNLAICLQGVHGGKSLFLQKQGT